MSISKTCYAVDFEEVQALNNVDINKVLGMLTESGLKKFLSCALSYNVSVAKQFFLSAKIIHGSIACTFKNVEYTISQKLFADTLELPSGGIEKISDIPDGNSDMWKLGFSLSENPISIPGEKQDLKPEFRILANIVAKSLLARAGAYDKITLEKFQYMALIASRILVDWSGILFNTLLDMVRGKGRSEGFALQICYILSNLGVELDEMEPLHSKKYLNAATVADCLKRNSSGSSSVKKDPKPQGKETKKATSKTTKRKVVLDSDPDDVLIGTVFSSPTITAPRKPRSKKQKVASKKSQPEATEEEPHAKAVDEEPRHEAIFEKSLSQEQPQPEIREEEPQAKAVNEGPRPEDILFTNEEPQPEVISSAPQETAQETVEAMSQPETTSFETAPFSLSVNPLRTGEIFIREGQMTPPRTGPSIDPMDKGKGPMPPSPSPPTAVEKEVNLIIHQVIKSVQNRMKSFTRWYSYRTAISFQAILDEGNLQELAVLEQQMLGWTETENIEQALGRRSYALFQLREALLRLIIHERENIFDPQLPTAQHDGAVIHRLHTIHKLALKITAHLRRMYEMPRVPLDKTAYIYISLVLEMFKNFGTDLSSDNEHEDEQMNRDDDDNEDPDQGNVGNISSAHTTQQKEDLVSSAAQETETVDASSSGKSLIFEQSNIDQTGGHKEGTLESRHFSPSGHEATPSSSQSKEDQIPDISPIMPTKEGTTGADIQGEIAQEIPFQATAEQPHSPQSSSSKASDLHAQPDLLAERLSNIHGTLETCRLKLSDINARQSGAEYALEALRKTVLSGVSDLQREINKTLSEIDNNKRHISNALLTLSGQATKTKQN